MKQNLKFHIESDLENYSCEKFYVNTPKIGLF